MTTKEQIKKEFNAFAGKVQKLESLRRQLNSLNTAGFEKEVQLIKSDLKNMSAIPKLTRQIDSLKSIIDIINPSYLLC